MAGQDLPVVYHATLASYLPGITERGLQPSGGRGAGVGKGAYGAWSAGKIFLSGPQDANYWFNRVEEHGDAGSDDLRRDGAVPVMLRIRNLRRLLQDDTVARSEHQLDSYYVRRPIPARQIEYFDGRRWRGLDISDEDDVADFCERHTNCERDEVDEDEREQDEGVLDEQECDYTSLRMVRRELEGGPVEMTSTFPPELFPG